MNNHAPKDLFDLMMRWDVEAKTILPYLMRRGSTLSQTERRNLLHRRVILNRAIEELRNAMAEMTVRYRGVIDGVVVIESDNEEECWARVKNEGTVEFNLSTSWALTDSAIAHEK